MLDLANNVLVARIGLVHDRRMGIGIVADDEIDLEQIEELLGSLNEERQRRRILFTKVLGVRDDRLLDRVEPGYNSRLFRVTPLQVFEEHADGMLGDAPVELLDAFPKALLQPRHPLDVLLELVTKPMDRRLRRFALLRRELFELFVRQYLPFPGRGEHESCRCLQHANAFVRRALLELPPVALNFPLRVRLEGLELIPVVLTLECRRYGESEVFDEPFHVAAKLASLAGRKVQQLWPLAVGEVVHIAPVTRDYAVFRFCARELLGNSVTSGARGAEHEHVVPGLRNPGTETQRILGPLLAKVHVDRRTVSGYRIVRPRTPP